MNVVSQPLGGATSLHYIAQFAATSTRQHPWLQNSAGCANHTVEHCSSEVCRWKGLLRLLRVLPCQTDVQCTQQTTQNKRAQQNGAPQVASPLAFSKMTSHTTNTHTSTTQSKAEVEETTVLHDLLQKTIAASSNSDVQPLKTIFNCTYSQKWCRWQLYE
jgi:hypothetical protein